MSKLASKALTTLLISILLLERSLAAEVAPILASPGCAPPKDLYDLGCRCYDLEERRIIADTIVDLEQCEAELSTKNALIQDRLKDPLPAPAAWWQNPPVLFSGMVIAGFISWMAAIYTYDHNKRLELP